MFGFAADLDTGGGVAGDVDAAAYVGDGFEVVVPGVPVGSNSTSASADNASRRDDIAFAAVSVVSTLPGTGVGVGALCVTCDSCSKNGMNCTVDARKK